MRSILKVFLYFGFGVVIVLLVLVGFAARSD